MNVYLTIYKIVDYIYKILNFFLRISFKAKPGAKKLLRKNNKLNRIAAGKECFVIGNGPSLKMVDLNRLKCKDTFTCNLFYKDKNLNGFCSTYYAALDPNMYKDESLEYLKTLHKSHPKLRMFLRHSSKELLQWDDEFINYIYAKQFQEGNTINCDLTTNITAATDIVTLCIQIAIFLGYKKIYLLGADFSNYAQLSTTHFSEDYPGDDAVSKQSSMGFDALNAAREHFHHYALRKYADKNGIEIINLTPGSLIDAYVRKDLEEILQEK